MASKANPGEFPLQPPSIDIICMENIIPFNHSQEDKHLAIGRLEGYLPAPATWKPAVD